MRGRREEANGGTRRCRDTALRGSSGKVLGASADKASLFSWRLRAGRFVGSVTRRRGVFDQLKFCVHFGFFQLGKRLNGLSKMPILSLMHVNKVCKSAMLKIPSPRDRLRDYDITVIRELRTYGKRWSWERQQGIFNTITVEDLSSFRLMNLIYQVTSIVQSKLLPAMVYIIFLMTLRD